MTDGEKAQLKKTFVVASAYYNQKLSDDIVRYYVQDLEDLALDDVIQAFRIYRADPKNKGIPLPAMLRAIVMGSETKEERAREIAARVYGAIAKHGDYWTMGRFINGVPHFDGGNGIWPSWSEAAIAEFGEEGLAVVHALGGWQSFLKYSESANSTTLMAQLRDLAVTLVKKISAPEKPQIAGSTQDLISGVSGKLPTV